MKHNKKILLKAVMCFAISATLFLQGSIDALAITTKFCVPTISDQFTPDNVIYKSPNLNIQAEKWGYGLSANILNTSNVSSLLAELHGNVSPSSYGKAILGIYMNGTGLSDSDAASIAGAGWTNIELYYDTYFVGGCAPSGAMTPYVGKAGTENASAASASATLSTAGITENIAMVEVSGVNMAQVNYILYEPDFKFLSGQNLYSYKYIADLDVFVTVPESYWGSYDANFLEIYDLQLAEADVNGLYVTLTQSLPEDIVVTADEISVLRENPPVTEVTTSSTEHSSAGNPGNLTTDTSNKTTTETSDETTTEASDETTDESFDDNDTASLGNKDVTQNSSKVNTSDNTEETHESENESTNNDALVISNSDNTVAWIFAEGQSPENFTAEASVEVLTETEISVDFAYSGQLPQGTEVTVQIPPETCAYQDGDTLYFYYCNPESNQREFVSEGTYQGNQVTFQINHCSEYVISSIGPDATEITGNSNTTWILLAAIGVTVCGIIAGIVIFKKKK